MASVQIVIDMAGEAAGLPGVARVFAYAKIDPSASVVTLSLSDVFGVDSYFWEIIDQPVGASAVLDDDINATPTFTPTVGIPGSYYIRCTINGGSSYGDNGLAFTTEIRSRRKPAASERTIFDPKGWHPEMSAFIDQYDALAALGIPVDDSGFTGLLVGSSDAQACFDALDGWSGSLSMDESYDIFGSNPAIVHVDNAEGQGDLVFDAVGAFSVCIDLENTTGTVDGFQVYDGGSEYFRVIRKADGNLAVEATVNAFDVVTDSLSLYYPVNDGNPQLQVGSSDTNEGIIQAVYDSGLQTLDYLLISTDSDTDGHIVVSPASDFFGINVIAPQTNLHVRKSGVVLAFPPSALVAAFQNDVASSTGSQIAVVSGITGEAAVLLGDTNGITRGILSYDNSSEVLGLGTAGTGNQLVLSAGNVGIGTIDLDDTPPIGRLTIAAASGGNILVGRNYLDVNKIVVDEDGHLTLSDGAYIAGKFTEVALTNRNQVYIEDSFGEVFKYQNFYYSGSFIATTSYGIGHLALQNNTGPLCSGIGKSALQNNTGGYSCGFGFSTLQNNDGASCNGFGYSALQANTGAACNGVGETTLRYNTGSSCNGFGSQSLYSNLGDSCNGVGRIALETNVGTFCNGIGRSSLQFNTGNACNAIGYLSLRYGDGDDNVAIGDSAWSSFIDNAAGNKTFAFGDVDAGTDRITVTSHGFGGNGTYHNIKYTEGTSPITGLSDGAIIQAYIVDANTIQTDRTDNITAAGSGTGHTLTPQYEYTNTIVLGADQDPTASNQVILGNTAVLETILRGTLIIDGIKLNGQGTDLASANDTAVPDGHSCAVTGAVQMNTMAVTGWKTGDFPLVLHFVSTPLLKHATAGAGAQFRLAGSGDFQTSAGDNITFDYDGTDWVETSRTVI